MCASAASRWFESEDVGNDTVVRFTGAKSLDEPTSQAVGAELDGLVAGMAGRRLILDFAQVTYLGSGALAVLLALNKKVRDAGGGLVVVNLDPKLYEIFVITNLNKIIDIAKTGDGFDLQNRPKA